MGTFTQHMCTHVQHHHASNAIDMCFFAVRFFLFLLFLTFAFLLQGLKKARIIQVGPPTKKEWLWKQGFFQGSHNSRERKVAMATGIKSTMLFGHRKSEMFFFAIATGHNVKCLQIKVALLMIYRRAIWESTCRSATSEVFKQVGHNK